MFRQPPSWDEAPPDRHGRHFLVEALRMVPLHRKEMADGKGADAILSAVRYELEERGVGFLETHGPDDDGWVQVDFEETVGRREGSEHLRAALDAVASGESPAHYDEPVDA